MRDFLTLTKVGIAVFVMLTGFAGYAVAIPIVQEIDLIVPLMLMAGLYLVSSGSFAINQAQEWRTDGVMPRTAKRPVPAGRIGVVHAYFLGGLMAATGICILSLLNIEAALLSLATIVLYNGLYTIFWKRRWAFGAVPGAIPGAMPVVIGYAAAGESVFDPACVYLFLIMFLWQMPHFWSLAIRFSDDYHRGGFPVLPAKLGISRTLYHIGLYTFAYMGLALAAPLFIHTHFLHLVLVIPFSLKVGWEFYQYFKKEGKERWLPFFLWVNLSLIVFVCVPVFDRWLLFLLEKST